MAAWDFLVDRHDLSRTTVAEGTPADASLAPGDVLLAIERFSLTANNITYGVVGDRLGYWQFFPADGGWGRIPVWGFARVVRSQADGVAEGLRLYGYWPMSTHLVARLEPSGSGYVDRSPHRAALPPAYNGYAAAPPTPRDDHLALLRPLFTTSFLLDDWLDEAAPDAVPLLSSASSRTALGLAWLLRRRGAAASALTSARHAGFLRGLGTYDRVLTYDDIDTAAIDGSVAFVDMAGNAGVRAAVHRRFGDRLRLSAIVGSTHHDAPAEDGASLPGPRPAFFFAPDRLVQRRRDWGAALLERRIGEAMAAFIDASAWLSIRHHHGPDALASLYNSIRRDQVSPDIGHIVLPM